MTTDVHSPEAHHGPNVQAYLVVFGALSVFTAVSFVVNEMVRRGILTTLMGMLLILGVAVVKAILVAIYFMHLKYDWWKLFFIIVPCCVLAAMLVVVLLPDMVLAWHH